MNIIKLSKIMASYQRAIKTISCKPDGNGASKMEGGRYHSTLRQRRSDTLDLVYNEFTLNCILDTCLILKLPILE